MPNKRPRKESRLSRSYYQRFRKWFLLDGNRLHVMAVTDAAILGFLILVTISPLVPYNDLQSVYLVFSRMIGGNITIVSIVVVLNQLLISRELHTPDELRSQMEGVLEYRNDIEDITGQLPPAEPLGLLWFLNKTTHKQVQWLDELLDRADVEPAAADELAAIVTPLEERADEMDDLLDEQDVSTFDVLVTTLTTNHARQINELRRIQRSHAQELSWEASEAIDDLVSHLQDIDIPRQYFKTIYLREELASLSRMLFYVGLVSLALVSAGMMLFTGPNTIPLLRPYVPLLVPVIIVVGILPISLLFVYILRAATVTKRTAATLPFTSPSQEHR